MKVTCIVVAILLLIASGVKAIGYAETHHGWLALLAGIYSGAVWVVVTLGGLLAILGLTSSAAEDLHSSRKER